MNLFTSLSGLIAVEITGADLPGTMAALNGADIPFYYAAENGELSMILSIQRSDFQRLNALCEKRGESLRILRKRGLYWILKSLFGRPLLVAGFAVLLLVLLYLPSRVFFLRVEGNTAVPTNLILEAAESCGIRFGASRREVRSERMKNALLEAVPELQWAGVNTSGCVAVISVRERSITDQPVQEHSVSSIVAKLDGIIISCTATGGNLLCAPGQAVKEGEVLISGYTDCGLTIQATRAEGEIFAQTIRKISAIFPSQYTGRGEILSVHRSYNLLIGKKRINLWKDSGISDTSCGRMYEEYYVTLPGNFVLPIGLAMDVYTEYSASSMEMDELQAQTFLDDFSESYLRNQMVAGEILSGNRELQYASGTYRLEGEYVCTEMIGKVQQEQIGEHYGEDQ